MAFRLLKTSSPEPVKSYRYLEEGEIIRIGDEFLWDTGLCWEKLDTNAGIIGFSFDPKRHKPMKREVQLVKD